MNDVAVNPISSEVRARIANNFTYHKPTGQQPQKYENIRELCGRLAIELNHLCPQSRELSLAMTKLEEVVFWANAAIARNEKGE